MKLPNRIGPIFDSGDELKGIIYTLRTRYKIDDPMSSHIVVPQSYGQELSDIRTLIFWNASKWRTGMHSDAWVQLTFPNRKIIPTAYSLKSITGGLTYAHSWKVYGFNSYESYYSESHWDVISENTENDNPAFCAKKSNGGMCDDTTVATFKMSNANKISPKGYDTIRWKLITPKIENNPRFSTAALEVYGTLITPGSCSKHNYIINFHSTFIIISIMILF